MGPGPDVSHRRGPGGPDRRGSGYFALHPGRIDRVIPNPVVRPEPQARRSGRPRPPYRVLGMGRLGLEKGFDQLLSAFAEVAPRFPEWDLEIWGEGTERPALERHLSELGLAERARLPGVAKHSTELMRSADLFVLSSRFEGFPNVLCEAMACGLPSSATIARAGRGRSSAMRSTASSSPRRRCRRPFRGPCPAHGDPAERRRLETRAPEVIVRFDLDRVMGLWDELLDELLHD